MALSAVLSTFFSVCYIPHACTPSDQSNVTAGNFEALSRPRIESSNETGGPESDTDPAHEPLSGVGAS